MINKLLSIQRTIHGRVNKEFKKLKKRNVRNYRTIAMTAAVIVKMKLTSRRMKTNKLLMMQCSRYTRSVMLMMTTLPIESLRVTRSKSTRRSLKISTKSR